MALDSFRWRRILRSSISTLIGCGCIGAVGTIGLSALLNWDPSADPTTLGGTGTWDYNPTSATPLLWDDNGSLPNFNWTDTTGVNTAVFKGTPGLVQLGAPITANGLRFDVTGYTIDSNGSAANTLSLIKGSGASAPAITINAANVTAAINASILGNVGLTFSAGAFTGTTTQLTGDNHFIGGVTISSGTVELGNAGALNQSAANSLALRALPPPLPLKGDSVT